MNKDELHKILNSFRLMTDEVEWLVFGVHDSRRDASGMLDVIGTVYKNSTKSLNQIKKSIADHTPQRTTFNEIHEVIVDGKRVLMFEIPAAPLVCQ